jgi:hypothetical protein
MRVSLEVLKKNICDCVGRQDESNGNALDRRTRTKRASSNSSGSVDGAGAELCRVGRGGRPAMVVCRFFFATQQRIAITESSSNTKKPAVPRGEDIRKKKGEKSCNFGEIIKKLHFIV